MAPREKKRRRKSSSWVVLLSGLFAILIIIVLGIIWFATGQNPIDILTGGGGTTTSSQTGQQWTPSTNAGQDELANFVGVVVKDTENLWGEVFKQNNLTYKPPKVVLFTDATQSACGTAESASGPFYCPGDHKVYLDMSFFDELANKFDAAGDFAQAYVVAHEVGHHVQNLTGILPRFNQQRQRMSEAEANQMSVRVELQADCYAGIWGKYTQQKGLLESGDLDEALNAATQIGDDTLQKRMQGYVVPESFNHGTSEQRRRWFKRGFDSGRLDACNTFQGEP